MDVHGILDNVEAQVVGLANNLAAPQAATGHPHAVGVRVVIATGTVGIVRPAKLHHGSPAKLPAPDHERLVQKPALLEVSDEVGVRLIDLLAPLRQVLVQPAVVIPARVHHQHETDSPLDHPPGKQAVGRVLLLAFVVAVDAVAVENVPRLVGEVQQFRG